MCFIVSFIDVDTFLDGNIGTIVYRVGYVFGREFVLVGTLFSSILKIFNSFPKRYEKLEEDHKYRGN